MTILEIILIFLTVLFIYFLIVSILHKAGILEKYGITLYGPALLIKTNKGKKFLQKISKKKRFWKSYGTFAVVFCIIAMIIVTAIIIWNAWMAFSIDFTPEQKAILPGPEVALVLPGINPILPLEYVWYIIIAMVVGIIAHEFSHGILAMAHDLKVKSLGLLYLIIPIGAFVEPDEEELKETKRIKRMRVFAVGPLSNLVIAFITLLLFSFVFMSAVQPVDGVNIVGVIKDTPANEAGLSSGIVITGINNTQINNLSDFSNALDKTHPNQTVNITYYYNGKTYHTNANLTSIYTYTKNESHRNMSYLGVKLNLYNNYINYLKNPFVNNFPESFLLLYALPFFVYLSNYNPIAAPFTGAFEITGPLGALPSGLFWGITNLLYWIFWLNLAIGIFNVLPISPLDGGLLFNDTVKSIVKRVKKELSEEKQEKIARNISLIVSLTILTLVISPFFIKYI